MATNRHVARALEHRDELGRELRTAIRTRRSGAQIELMEKLEEHLPDF
jgi:hypothetical protein